MNKIFIGTYIYYWSKILMLMKIIFQIKNPKLQILLINHLRI